MPRNKGGSIPIWMWTEAFCLSPLPPDLKVKHNCLIFRNTTPNKKFSSPFKSQEPPWLAGAGRHSFQSQPSAGLWACAGRTCCAQPLGLASGRVWTGGKSRLLGWHSSEGGTPDVGPMSSGSVTVILLGALDASLLFGHLSGQCHLLLTIMAFAATFPQG